MRQSWLVARFTFREAVRKRAFWITNIIYLIMLLGMMIVMPLVGGMDGDMNLNFGEGGFGNATAYLLDESSSHYLEPVRHSLQEQGMTVVVITPAQLDESLAAITEDSGAAVVHITVSEHGALHAEIIMRDMMSRFPANGVGALINLEFRHAQLIEAGVEHEVSTRILQSEVIVEPTWQAGFAAMGASLVLMMIMFMSVHSYGTSVAMSVATEKSTRVMETLIVSAKPPRILVGKVIGMGSVGLVQMLGLITIAGLLGGLTSSADAPIEMSMGDINLWVAPLLLLYFLAGYALYALINAMLGAMVSKLEDLNSALAPAAIVTMISFYAGGLGPMITGGGQVGRAVMFIPFTAPFAAPTVLLSGDLDTSVVLPSMLILVGSVIFLSWIAGKVYSASVLHYGSRLKYKDVGKLVKGNKK
ncbi:MAG: ABC transporter permease [Oscillospiraceae bacterium]|nr:ABC transporter permease [Oscillospiraceae bacterium]